MSAKGGHKRTCRRFDPTSEPPSGADMRGRVEGYSADPVLAGVVGPVRVTKAYQLGEFARIAVRGTGPYGLWRSLVITCRPMSAPERMTDSTLTLRHVRKLPKADSCTATTR